MDPHPVLNPAVPYWNWIALGFGWRSDNRRSSLTFRGIVQVARDEGSKESRRESQTRKFGWGQVVVEQQAGTVEERTKYPIL